MAELPPWLTRFRAVGVVSVALLVVLSGLYLTGGYDASPCRDDLGISAYPRTFDFEASESGVTITFADGEPFTAENTLELFVVVSDDESNRTEHVTWGTNRTDEFPIEPRATIRVENSSIDAFPLDAGDTVEVGWRGFEKPLPRYCLNDRNGEPVSVVYGRFVVP